MNFDCDESVHCFAEELCRYNLESKSRKFNFEMRNMNGIAVIHNDFTR